MLTCIISFTLVVHKSTAQQSAELPAAVNGKTPFTNLPFNDDTSKIQFAIVSDLWGGNRPGVFEDAVSKLELLQPQFVMSVGDLTDGKTYDTILMDKQWKEFNNEIKPLSMPFFYVPGNHDIANPKMEEEWKKKFGEAYYYFVYKNVLFLIVNTQDKNGFDGISDEQIAYFKKGIDDHPNVRWTFIFMHRPVWNDKNEDGFEKIEAFLKGYNFTVFSGHHHTYEYVNKNGTKYFMLATTGGASDLFGAKYGLSDQLTWVTLNENEAPKIINMELSGLLKEDIVTEKNELITSTLVYQNWLITPSFVSEKELEESIQPFIIFDNPAEYPLQVFGNLSNDKRFHISPEKINLTVPPRASDTQFLKVTSASHSKMDFSKLQAIKFNLKGAYQYDTVHYELPAKKEMLLSWKYRLPELSDAKKLTEKNFTNGDTSGFFSIRNPEYLEDHWYWTGPEDALLQFKLAHDKKNIYLLAFVKDDELVMGKKGDLLYVDVEDKAGNPLHLAIYPFGKKPDISATGKGNISIKDLQLKSEIKDNSLIKVMLQIPIDDVAKVDHSFRFNIEYFDQDNEPESHHASIFWKPRWGTVTDYKNSGTFILESENQNL